MSYGGGPVSHNDPKGVRALVEAGHDPGFYICEGPECYRPAVGQIEDGDEYFCEDHYPDEQLV